MLPNANLGNRACFVKRKFASYSAKREPGNQVAILNTVFTVKNWARFCNVTELKKYPYLARFRIHSVFKNIHSGEHLRED